MHDRSTVINFLILYIKTYVTLSPINLPNWPIGQYKKSCLSSFICLPISGLSDKESDEKRIVRHSLPYGTASGQCGLFFIAYSKTPRTLDWMLDRMAGLVGDGNEDGLFHFTTALTGTYFYSPSKAELENIFKEGGAGSKKFGLF